MPHLNLEAFSDFLSSHTTTLAICPYTLEEVKNCGNHVLVSGENHRNPPGNHTRRGYCFWPIFKVICHCRLVAILNFGQRKSRKQFFLNPHVSE